MPVAAANTDSETSPKPQDCPFDRTLSKLQTTAAGAVMRRVCVAFVTLPNIVARSVMLAGQSKHVNWWQWLNNKAKQLKQQAVALYYAMQDPQVGWVPRIIIVFALGYALSPIDLIPDFIPILGILDDVILLPAMFWLAIKLIPHTVMESATKRAQQDPLQLSKSWSAAVVIFLLWDVTALAGITFCCRRFGNLYWQKHYWVLLIVVGSVLLVTELGYIVFSLVCMSEHTRDLEEGTDIEDETDNVSGANYVSGANSNHTARLLDVCADSKP